MGVMEGRKYGRSSMTTRATWSDEGAETPNDFKGRGFAWWEELVQMLLGLKDRDEPYNVLAVSHGGFIGTLVRQLIQTQNVRNERMLVVQRTLLNCSISLIELNDDGEGLLVKYSDVEHMNDGAGLIQDNVDVAGE